MEETKTILGYTLVNTEKLNRAINGSVGAEGKLFGGVGEDASDEAIIAEYDRLGGLILKGKYKVKTGSFYDFSKRKPRATPNVLLVFKDLDGQTVEIGENEEIPMEVRAAEKVKEKKETKAKAGGVKRVKRSLEDEDGGVVEE